MGSTSDSAREDGEALGPWNPGLRSPVPREVLPLATLYRPENALADLTEVLDLADFTGLQPAELVAFTPARLVTHELLVRVAADISVPDGPDSEDLGVSLRSIAGRISERHLAPHLPELVQRHAALRREIEDAAREALAELDPPPLPQAPTGLAARLGLRRTRRPDSREEPQAIEERALERWRRLARDGDRRERALAESLVAIVGAVRARHARVLGDRALLVRLVADRVCNDLGGEALGEAIAPLIEAAIDAEGYHRLPAQPRPVVMNTKGASASGKSRLSAGRPTASMSNGGGCS